jgi:nicotinate phosphoribosyltransferase
VYKLAAKTNDSELDPTIKLSNQPSKTTNPGVKQVYRFFDDNDSPLADLITLVDEEITSGKRYTFHHPDLSARKFEMAHYARIEPLLKEVMADGKRHSKRATLTELQERCVTSLKRLDHTYQRIINPHVYKVSLSGKLAELKRELVSRYTAEI